LGKVKSDHRDTEKMREEIIAIEIKRRKVI